MVGLVNKFAATIEEKKGSLSEDEVCRPEIDSSPECEWSLLALYPCFPISNSPYDKPIECSDVLVECD